MVTNIKQAIICVIGVGFVGLPLSNAFAGIHRVISFDIDQDKIRRLNQLNQDPKHIFTNNPKAIAEADFISICVPTLLTKSKEPNMSYVEAAARIVGKNMKNGAIIILESTVYPGVTEEIVKPILEEESGLKCGESFEVAYSPERINPGDTEHTIEKVTKIVAANNIETLNIIADLYSEVALNIYKAKSIKTAEAAKLVENTQRDINIAFINELSILFKKMDLNTNDVLEAASTKWNFQRFSPGLVGGYCIPVVPYFFLYKAKELGYNPQIIQAGRSVNDKMSKYIVEIAIKSLNNAEKVIKHSKVLIMGLTYKENVEDTRETPIRDLIKELHEFDIEVFGFDPLVQNGESDFGIKFIKNLSDSNLMDCIILAVPHDVFKNVSLEQLKRIANNRAIFIDIKGFYDTQQMKDSEFVYIRL